VRILQIVSYFAPAWGYGGPPRVMTEYAAGLFRRGHDITVLTTDVLDGDRRARPRYEVIDGVHVYRYVNLSNALAWHAKKYLPPGLILAALLRARRFDFVHATDARTVATAAAFLAASSSRIPFCLSAHGSLPGSSGFRGAVKRAYDAALVRPMLRYASLLLAQTEHERRLVLEAGGRPESTRLLPLPTDPNAGLAARSIGLLRKRAGIAPNARIALFLGRIHWLKGLDLLIDALAPMLAPSELVLVVAGRDDGHWDSIRRRFADLIATGRVRYVGPMYGEERFAAYAEADVFCLTPRHWEETSLATLEAASAGTAVVVTEQSEIPGLEQAGGGFVVSNDGDEIAKSVGRVLADAAAMGERARDLVRRQHDTSRVVERLEALLLERADAHR
jgi:glycosyltransferase involved in cell wall biosynthesis